MADSQRIEDLRRRVQKDPASIAFAQLAEECRRAGQHQESVDVCRAGLAIHPAYLSARVTLGRALIELNELDQALTELSTVLKSAPENLAAIRGVAEIHHRRGELAAALAQYRAALALARNDPDLQRTVAELARQIEPAPPPAFADGLSFEQMQDEFLKLAPPPAAAPRDKAAEGVPPSAAPLAKAAEAAQDLTEPVAAIEPPSRPAPDATSPSPPPSQPAAQEASPPPASALQAASASEGADASAPQAVSAFEGVDASNTEAAAVSQIARPTDETPDTPEPSTPAPVTALAQLPAIADVEPTPGDPERVALHTEDAPVALQTEDASVALHTEDWPVALHTDDAPVALHTEETPAAVRTEDASATLLMEAPNPPVVDSATPPTAEEPAIDEPSLQTIAALERWLDAIHVARAERSA